MAQKVLKILLLEDEADDAGLIERTLIKRNILFESLCVQTKEDFLEGISKFHPDVILSDHSLPQFNSIEALKICRNAGLEVPFILVTGTVSEEFAVSCLKAGADDYVLKTNLTRLPSAITNSLKQHEHELYRKRTERALKKQNAKLIKINKELDSFVYSVSHNLRAPLASVLGLLNIARLDNKAKDFVLEKYFTMMEKSIRNLDETLKEIVDYSKNANHELTIKEVNVESLIDNCLEKLRYLEGFDQVERKISIDQKAPFYSDEFRLSLVFNNLISNAIIFRDEQKQHSFIHISATINSKDVTLQVEDNGIGVLEQLQAKVFSMFFRGSERSQGSGLGLYIVRETIEKLNGKIEIESQAGVGTKFRIGIRNMVDSTNVNKTVRIEA